MARLERFELPTYCSVGSRSIQLSYKRARPGQCEERVGGVKGFFSFFRSPPAGLRSTLLLLRRRISGLHCSKLFGR